jgi:hypothetical protein
MYTIAVLCFAVLVPAACTSSSQDGSASQKTHILELVNTILSYNPDDFELYDVSQDQAEQQDLKASEPGRFQKRLKEWERFKSDAKVQILTPAPGSTL